MGNNPKIAQHDEIRGLLLNKDNDLKRKGRESEFANGRKAPALRELQFGPA
jgi:hypothetical protein